MWQSLGTPGLGSRVLGWAARSLDSRTGVRCRFEGLGFLYYLIGFDVSPGP